MLLFSDLLVKEPLRQVSGVAAKTTLVMSTFHIQVPGFESQVQIPACAPWKAPCGGSSKLTCVEFLAPGFDLDLLWLLWPLGQ